MAEQTSGRFHIHEIAQAFPETAETMLLDTYLTDGPGASTRVFRVYRGTPAHYHAGCDEYLYVVSGRGTFWMGVAANKSDFAPGDFLYFERGTVHALPEIHEGPVIFLSMDVPRREPSDIIFVDRKEGTPESFIQQHR